MVRQAITKQGIQRRRQGPTLQFKIQTLWQRKITKQMGWTIRRHSVSPTGAVTIMDAKGDQYVVNGQRLKVFLEPDVVPLHYIDIYTMEEEPERQA